MTRSLRFMVPALLALLLALITAWMGLREADRAAAEVERVALTEMNRVLTRAQGSLELGLTRGDDKWVRDVVADLGADPTVELAVLLDEQDRVVTSTRLEHQDLSASEVIPAYKQAETEARMLAARSSLIAGEQPCPLGHAAIGIYPVAFGPAEGAMRTPRVGVLYVKTDLMAGKQAARAEVRYRLLRRSIVIGGLFLGLGIFLHFGITSRIGRIAQGRSLCPSKSSPEK